MVMHYSIALIIDLDLLMGLCLVKLLHHCAVSTLRAHGVSIQTHAHLEVTGGVNEQVGGFEVTVQHISWMDVLEAPQNLVEKIADMVIAQSLAFQQLVQVRLHQSLHNVAEKRLGQGWKALIEKIHQNFNFFDA